MGFTLKPRADAFQSPFSKKRLPGEGTLAAMDKAAIQKANGYDFRKKKAKPPIPQGNATAAAVAKVGKEAKETRKITGGLPEHIKRALDKANRTLELLRNKKR